MRADDLLEILKPVSAQIDEERLPALGGWCQDPGRMAVLTNPAAPPTLSRGAGPSHLRPTAQETGGTALAAAAEEQTERPQPAPPGADTAPVPPRQCGGRSCSTGGREAVSTTLCPAAPLSPGFAPGSTFSPVLRTQTAGMSPALCFWRGRILATRGGGAICRTGVRVLFEERAGRSLRSRPAPAAALPGPPGHGRETMDHAHYSYLLRRRSL